ncbi:YdcF family protein [Mycobacterium sp.]|uniref:YdcF family protein n=1 Tax=Mycobacterium sp. TaxID=1785 RepID=UPI002D92B1A5|nr:ElyC/SanA/YdcF family protein [Mycobacterium sp.]
MRRVDPGRVILESIAAVLVIVLIDVGLAGIVLFTHAKEDQLQRADAIVVLAGEHDGREEYALRLAREGWAPTVVLSNPYLRNDTVMKEFCRPVEDVEVICGKPRTLTTRGEADMVRQLAQQRSWTKIIVVTWRYHIPRARLVFRQCYSDDRHATVMRAMPREYQYSFLQWEFMYFYQFAGFAKAVLQGTCA